MICSTSICAVIPLQRYKTPFLPVPNGITRPACTLRPISIPVCCWSTWRNGGNTISQRNCCKLLPPLTNPFPYGDQCFLNTVFQKLAATRRILELPNRRSRILPKRNLGEVFPKPDTVPPVIHYTTTRPNLGCAITAKFLLSKPIGNTIAPTGRKRNFRQGTSPSITLKQNKRPSEIVSDGL